MFVFLCFFYCRMYNYMYLCTNKGKNMIKITIRLIIPILRIRILQPAVPTNFTQNWREHYTLSWLFPFSGITAWYIDRLGKNTTTAFPVDCKKATKWVGVLEASLPYSFL